VAARFFAAPQASALTWRQLVLPCLITLVGGTVFYALVVQLSFVLDGLGVTSSAAIGGVSAAMSVATAAGSASFAKLSKHRPHTLLPIAFGLAAIGLGLVCTAGSVVVVTVGAMVTGAGTGLLLPVLLTWATNRLRFEERGRGTGRSIAGSARQNPRLTMSMTAPSSARSRYRASSSVVAPRVVDQSPPPGSTTPFSRGPATVPPVIGVNISTSSAPRPTCSDSATSTRASKANTNRGSGRDMERLRSSSL
jgi:hypothetical protein